MTHGKRAGGWDPRRLVVFFAGGVLVFNAGFADTRDMVRVASRRVSGPVLLFSDASDVSTARHELGAWVGERSSGDEGVRRTLTLTTEGGVVREYLVPDEDPYWDGPKPPSAANMRLAGRLSAAA